MSIDSYREAGKSILLYKRPKHLFEKWKYWSNCALGLSIQSILVFPWISQESTVSILSIRLDSLRKRCKQSRYGSNTLYYRHINIVGNEIDVKILEQVKCPNT